MGRLVTGGGYGGLDILLRRDSNAGKEELKEETEWTEVKSQDIGEVEKGSEVDACEMEVPCAGNQFIDGLGIVLMRWVEATSSLDDKSRKMTHFHSARPPRLSICEYLARIRKYFVASDECYVLALVYIDRASKNDASMAVCELNVHRLLIVASMLAAKFNDDAYYSNSYYATVGGISLKELNALEARFLKIMNWKLLVSPKDYELYHSLVCKASSQESL